MPCLFKTAVKQSGIEGKGFFSLEDIPKGAVYWVYESENPMPVEGYDAQPNRIYNQAELEAVTDIEKLKHILHTGFYYADGDVFIELRDGAEFTNHSDDWNSQIIYDEGKDYRKMTCIARKAIKAGEEITAYYGNYLSTEAKWVDDLMEKHIPDRKKLENHVIQSGNKAKNWKIEE